MPRLIITADVHGSHATWLTLKSLMAPADHLVVAGDLFDTRYGQWYSPDFQPDRIRSDLPELKDRLHYVYGNCDEAHYCPGYEPSLTFDFDGFTLFLHHGHRPLPDLPSRVSIVIQGHTHRSCLEKKQGIIFLNPGSLTAPRNHLYTYAVMTPKRLSLMDLTSNKEISFLTLSP